MSESLAVAASALRDGLLPRAWQDVAYPSCRPLASWVADLRLRIDTHRLWEQQKKLPVCFCMSYMFFPQGFLTSLLQAFSRSSGAHLETIKFQHSVKSEFGRPADVHSPPSEGVFVSGIVMQGARWDVHSQQIEDCRPGALHTPMPIIHFIPVAANVILASSLLEAHVNIEFAKESGLSMSMPSAGGATPKTATSPAKAMANRTSDIQARRHRASAEEGGRPSPASRSMSQADVTVKRSDSLSRSMTFHAGPAGRSHGGKIEALQQEQYECPLYRTSKQDGALLSSGQAANHICMIYLPTAAESKRWILAGVSLVCEADE